jgi:hypothetical protein
MDELTIKVNPKKFVKPIEFLSMMDRALEESLLKHVDSIQDIIQDMLINYVQSNGAHEDTKHIQFSIEVTGRNFSIKPHNLYTFILSDGICVPYSSIHGINRYITDTGTYVFNPATLDCIYAPYHEIEVSKKLTHDK